jgi:nucleoside-diphosphate-sugar epimerase
MKIGVTGASGHLGKRLVPAFRSLGLDVKEIGRHIQDPLDIELLVHLAAPRQLDQKAVSDFQRFNIKLLNLKRKYGFAICGAGSLWQLGSGVSKNLPYSHLKDWQQQELHDCTLILYSVYSDELRQTRGFIPLLVDSLRTGKRINSASSEKRDWVHVEDVIAAFAKVVSNPISGTYEIRTGRTISPAELVEFFTGTKPSEFNQTVPYQLEPTYPTLPSWQAKIEVIPWIESQIH